MEYNKVNWCAFFGVKEDEVFEIVTKNGVDPSYRIHNNVLQFYENEWIDSLYIFDDVLGSIPMTMYRNLTDREKAVFVAYGSKYKWIARDLNDSIYLYEDKPIKGETFFYTYTIGNDKGTRISSDLSNLFDFITFESGSIEISTLH